MLIELAEDTRDTLEANEDLERRLEELEEEKRQYLLYVQRQHKCVGFGLSANPTPTVPLQERRSMRVVRLKPELNQHRV